MVDLTSLNRLIISLISKSLGKHSFTFIVYKDKKTILEFKSSDYSFILSKVEDNLRVYDNGNTYYIKNTLLTDSFYIEQDIKNEAFNLQNYYDLEVFKNDALGSVAFSFTKKSG
jgi:hypothetical protein